eukprot:CAMPEP_0117459732 /NCGR_PEP_ID=MMETSP0784-20121206/1633_1 /TAXON_ID=39447 /ORGANISM="" /LENGTH=381 /DNA_ID=CAMNT_0005253361 /DNA_START=1 /DNA_END=1143 /DNA_ORIENTATION=-
MAAVSASLAPRPKRKLSPSEATFRLRVGEVGVLAQGVGFGLFLEESIGRLTPADASVASCERVDVTPADFVGGQLFEQWITARAPGLTTVTDGSKIFGVEVELAQQSGRVSRRRLHGDDGLDVAVAAVRCAGGDGTTTRPAARSKSSGLIQPAGSVGARHRSIIRRRSLSKPPEPGEGSSWTGTGVGPFVQERLGTVAVATVTSLRSDLLHLMEELRGAGPKSPTTNAEGANDRDGSGLAAKRLQLQLRAAVLEQRAACDAAVAARKDAAAEAELARVPKDERLNRLRQRTLEAATFSEQVIDGLQSSLAEKDVWLTEMEANLQERTLEAARFSEQTIGELRAAVAERDARLHSRSDGSRTLVERTGPSQCPDMAIGEPRA